MIRIYRVFAAKAVMVVALGMLALLAGGGAAHAGAAPWADVPRMSIEQAKIQPDETRVVVEGVLRPLAKHEEYELQDAGETVRVDIDDKYWQGKKPATGQRVRIYGVVDIEKKGLEIDAKKVEILTP